jgi:flagellin
MSEIGNIMQRMRELAVQSANGTNSAANRLNLDAEYQELEASVVEIVTRTDFNGLNLFGGTAISVQSGSDATDKTVLLGSGTAISAAALSLTGDINTEGTADTAIAAIDAGLVVLNTARAQFGAAQNRLEFTSSVLQIREENAMASESAIRDADIARETKAFTRNQILVSAGTSMLAQSNLVPQNALQLLG